MSNWEEISRYDPPPEHGSVTCVRFSPNSELVVAGTSTGFLTLRRADEHLSDVVTKQIYMNSINEIKWSKDGQLILTCGDDGTLKLLKSEDLSILMEYKGHHSYVVTCDLSPNSLRIVSGSYDESVRIWETASGKCLKMISAHSEPVMSVCFSQDNMFVLSSSWDNYCRIWSVHNGICVKSFMLFGCPVCFSSLSPNNEYLIASGNNSSIKLVDVHDEKLATIYRGHVNEQFCLFAGFCRNPNDDSQELYTASEDGAIVAWNVNTQTPVWRVDVCDGPTLCGDVASSGSHLVTGSSSEDNQAIRLFARVQV